MKIRTTADEWTAIQRAILSGSPYKIRLTLKQSPAARTLAAVATATERRQPEQPARPPVRRVQSILAQLAQRTESK